MQFCALPVVIDMVPAFVVREDCHWFLSIRRHYGRRADIRVGAQSTGGEDADVRHQTTSHGSAEADCR